MVFIGGKEIAWPGLVGIGFLMVSLCFYAFPPSFIGDHNIWILLMIWTFVLTMTVAMYAFSSKPQSISAAQYFCAAAALAILLTVVNMSTNSVWCCVSESNIKDICEAADRIVQIAERENMPYWVCFGSLLSAVREVDKPYQFLPWEHDIDFAFMEEDMPRMRELIKQESGIRFENQHNVYPTSWRAHVARNYVDFYIFRDRGENDIVTENGVPGELVIPKDKIFPLQKLKFCDREWNAPANIDYNLENLYGKNWRTRMYGGTCSYWMDGCS